MTSNALAELIKTQEPSDAIWQEAISLSELISSQHKAVLDLTLDALSCAHHPDTIAAISTCLIEHILEHDFSAFEKLEQKIRSGDDKVLFALSICSRFGASKVPANVARWDSLLLEYKSRLVAYRAPFLEN